MPLQNRVTPDNRIVADAWRGIFMGNKGGRIHNPETKELLQKRWVSKRWITCVTSFKGRQREVMGNSYTELFFLDEVSALAAGHRPCFECRREAANHFSHIWQNAIGKISGSVADAMDTTLHMERTGEKVIITREELRHLPDGAMIKSNEQCYAMYGDRFYQWSGEGYAEKKVQLTNAELLTPRSTLTVLKNGYQPVWHPTIR